MKIYDHSFNWNEWFVIIGLCIGIVVVLRLRKRFAPQEAWTFFLCGTFFGFFFDHTLSVIPISYYDVNDSSKFQVMDFLSYWMYGGYSYLFFYLYDRLRVAPALSPVYILFSSLVSLGLERVGLLVGLYHYDHGYKIFYSFDIYLLVQSIWVGLYYLIMRGQRQSTQDR